MKARIRKTGEIVEVICYNSDTYRSDLDNVTFIDSKGNEHDREQGLNFYWDFEPLDTDANIDWGQRRYEIAKAAIQGFCANPYEQIVRSDSKQCAEWAICFADALIAELKKK